MQPLQSLLHTPRLFISALGSSAAAVAVAAAAAAAVVPRDPRQWIAGITPGIKTTQKSVRNKHS